MELKNFIECMKEEIEMYCFYNEAYKEVKKDLLFELSKIDSENVTKTDIRNLINLILYNKTKSMEVSIGE